MGKKWINILNILFQYIRAVITFSHIAIINIRRIILREHSTLFKVNICFRYF